MSELLVLYRTSVDGYCNDDHALIEDETGHGLVSAANWLADTLVNEEDYDECKEALLEQGEWMGIDENGGEAKVELVDVFRVIERCTGEGEIKNESI